VIHKRALLSSLNWILVVLMTMFSIARFLLRISVILKFYSSASSLEATTVRLGHKCFLPSPVLSSSLMINDLTIGRHITWVTINIVKITVKMEHWLINGRPLVRIEPRWHDEKKQRKQKRYCMEMRTSRVESRKTVR